MSSTHSPPNRPAASALGNQRGFTLIEVIISVTIMAFISIYTANSIQSAVRSKLKIQKDVDRNAALRDAINVMKNDIRLAFNYRDINIELYNKAIEARKQRQAQNKKANNGENDESTTTPAPTGTPATDAPPPDPAATGTPAQELEPKEEVIVTHFLGESDNLHFTSLSNVRSIEDSQVSSQNEVGFFLENCSQRSDSSKKSQCLWRRSSPYIDNEVEKGGDQVVILENVTEFKLRYLGPGREEEWLDTWKSDENGDAVTKNKFPYAVEIKIKVKNKHDKKDKELAMTVVAPIRFPNNPLPADTTNDPNQPNGDSDATADPQTQPASN